MREQFIRQILTEQIFKLDTNSPSWLSWNIDIYSGRHRSIHKIKSGDYCISMSTGRYQVEYKGKTLSVSRLVWMFNYGFIPSTTIIDHIDGNPLNNQISNLRAVSHKINCQNTRARKEGLSGVNYVKTNTGYEYWRARWTDIDGSNQEKFFSIKRFGFEEAKKLATEHRLSQIDRLNSLGENYTERHGR